MAANRSFDAWFAKFASRVSRWTGTASAVALALLIILVWAITGPLFGFSDFWQLTINTGTTIVTFLMVFVIQNSQNRESCAVQIKLDELIRATGHAHNSLLDLEELTESDLETFKHHYSNLAHKARKHEIDLGELIAELEVDEAEEKALAIKRRQEAGAVERKQSPQHRSARKAKADV